MPFVFESCVLQKCSRLNGFFFFKFILGPNDFENFGYLSFIGMTPIEKLTLTGVVYPLNGKDYDYPIALVSNEFEESKAELHFSFESGLLAVIQSADKRK